METSHAGNGFTLRLLVLLLFALILFVGITSTYYIIANSDWSGIDKTLADTTKLFYVYASLLGICLFAAILWLVVDERKISKLTREIEKKAMLIQTSFWN